MNDEVKIAVLQERMDQIEKNLGEKIDRLDAAFSRYIEKSEERFAAKWTETALKWGIGLVCSVVFGSIMALVLK